MPNQRSKDKARIGGYITKQLKAQLVQYAKRRGMSVSSVINELLNDRCLWAHHLRSIPDMVREFGVTPVNEP